MHMDNCVVCDRPLQQSLQPWHFFCSWCGYEKSSLEPTINQHAAHQHIDETARETGLRALRLSNFRTLLTAVEKLKPHGGRLLEVGSAHGWFVEAAMDTYEVLGIEPDQAVCAATIARGLPVRNGFFPDALLHDEKFDLIVFNDVLEHIPAVSDLLNVCHERLNEGGYLVINLPSSNGIFYRVGKVINRLGHAVFFERLWQKGLPSPHVHYFNTTNLALLLEHRGFQVMVNDRLPVLSLSGLYTRISYTGKMGRVSKAIIYALVAVSLPLLRVLPSDIVYLIARKAESGIKKDPA